VGTFRNIGNNHSPGDVLLEYTADGEMAIVQNGNAKTIKVCGCLAAGTTIATPSGPVSIEQLQAGDNILSTEQNGQMTIATITQIVESAAVKMMRIFSGGSYMDLTQGHPVFSPTLGRKISVDSLRAGMSLLALSGLLLTVDSVAAVHYPTPVYDLQTDAGRGYFAGVEELLVSSNQCNLYLSGRNFNTSQIETIEEAVSTSIEAFISDIEHSADLLDFFREASGDVLRGKAEAWRVALQANIDVILRRNKDNVAFIRQYLDDSSLPNSQVSQDISTAGGYPNWHLNVTQPGRRVPNYVPTLTGKIYDFVNPNGSLFGRLFKHSQYGRIFYTFKWTKPDGNVIDITGLSAEIYENFIEFEIYLPTAVHGKGVGKAIFDDGIDYYQATGSQFNGIGGRWEGAQNPNGPSTNLIDFWNAVNNGDDYLTAAGKTWTGRRAASRGYSTPYFPQPPTQNLVIVKFLP
jgi:hypothetical protein